MSQWRLVFLFAAGVYIFTNTIFVIFGTGEEQKWNSQKSDKHLEGIFLTYYDSLLLKTKIFTGNTEKPELTEIELTKV